MKISKFEHHLVSVRNNFLFLISKFSFAGKTLGYMGYHCFLLSICGLPMGYQWATFVCSPLVAHREDFETYQIFVSEFSL